MANLVPAATFDDVYQLEEADPVQGGAGGISNRQGQQLANRTEYLKARLGNDYSENKTGSTNTAVLAHTPVSDACVQVFIGRLLAVQGEDYMIAGNTITFTPAIAAEDDVRVYYRGI
jgi:hypothetical protein